MATIAALCFVFLCTTLYAYVVGVGEGLRRARTEKEGR